MAAIALLIVSLLAGGAMVLGYQQYRPEPAGAQVPSSPTAAADGQAPPVRAADKGVVTVYRLAAPAVVSITSRATASNSLNGQQVPEEGAGSGVIVNTQGDILTNNHVVTEANGLDVTLAEGTRAPARVVGRDPGNDLAVFRVDLPPEKITVARLGRSENLQIGQPVVAIGNPFGLDQTATHGIVSATWPCARSAARTVGYSDGHQHGNQRIGSQEATACTSISSS